MSTPNPEERARILRDLVKPPKDPTHEEQLVGRYQTAIMETARTIKPIYDEAQNPAAATELAAKCLLEKLRSWDKDELLYMICVIAAVDIVDRIR